MIYFGSIAVLTRIYSLKIARVGNDIFMFLHPKTKFRNVKSVENNFTRLFVWNFSSIDM